MTEQLLGFLLQYGVVALVPVLLASAVGIPLPGSLLLVAAGAFATGGPLTLLPLLLGAIGATIAGNAIGYWIGEHGGTAALMRWGQRFHVGAGMIERADTFFARYGKFAVVLSRFPFSPLSAIINIIAGTARYSRRAFLVANLAGVSVWAAVYLGLGYAFAASWDVIADLLGGASQALTLALVVIVLLVLIVRAIKNHRDHEAEAHAIAEAAHDEAQPTPVPDSAR
ncbi:MAG TPA: DedA family protein [Thermomicrobiales bacterium]|jgi:membrane-associated protein